ncbi:uncharacterized protein LOC134833792 [Culicoides brevitarsis]|uniref:uncharacterized protein LOC134833792 n=1 Tax=Culicoides brevitarsis TaxID=469753 RepID=UPI00307BA35A
MAYVLRKIIELHFYWNDECSDPRVRDWPLMRDPGAGLLLLAGYLYFVKSLGPRLMQDRKPFKLDGIIKYYNLLQIILCGSLVFDAIRLGFFTKYSLLCEPVDYTESELGMQTARRAYLYFVIKVIDLLDTVFFVLRKKQNQVTFLHVYHHTGMVMLSWGGAKYFPGGHSVLMGLLNSFVHVVMYFYYFLTSLNPEHKKNLWWKKHITQLQMIQFGMIALHWIVLLFKPWLKPDCNFPCWPTFIIVPQNLFMFLLFFDFYRKTYYRKPKESRCCIEMASQVRIPLEFLVDKEVDKWPLMSSPVPVITILVAYLVFVLKVGPEWMKNREPFQLKNFMIAYNAYQCLFSCWLFSQAFVENILTYIFSFGCRTAREENPELVTLIVNCAWWFFFSKVVELLDTVFFVLRKKQNQVSFLHVYHHSVTCFFCWAYLKYMPDEQGVVIGALNSFVHIIMYFYYMVAAMGPKYQKFIWWKKYMTWIQLTQFGLMLVYLAMVTAFNCRKFHKVLTICFFINVAFMMYLFADFYRKAYKKSSKLEAATKKCNFDNNNNVGRVESSKGDEVKKGQ